MLGGAEEGGGGLVEKKKKTMNTMSSSCSCGESLQSLQLIPPDALDTLIYILEKRASCRGTFSHCRCRCCCFGRQCDCLLNSLVIALQVEKESQKNIPPRHKG